MTDIRAGLIEAYDEDKGPDAAYTAWISVLRKDVVQDEFGYEEGEFTVYPSQWHQLYAEGLTPRQAWQRALDAFAQERHAAAYPDPLSGERG